MTMEQETEFVELLWQLSLHALREVHRRTYAADVVSNPLSASLTDVAFSHAATLLPVTKARIALERRRFLKNAEIGVQRQAMWSNLAHEMTAEYRRLCAEEAYLQQELEKLHDLRNKVKMEGEPWDELVSSSSQNSHLVQRATRLWDSLLSRKSQHEVLASGPIEDLIAHREHRYRISGSSLLAAMDESTQVSSSNLDKDQADRSQAIVNRENVNESLSTCHSQTNNEKSSWIDDRSGRGQPTVDIAEVLRRWTHALQRIHKQSLHLAKANDGEGPDLLRSANDGGTSGHAESLAATLAEHRQHLANLAFSVRICVSFLRGDIIILFTLVPAQESSSDEVTDVTSRLSSVQIDKVSSNPAALKLPPLFSLTPNSAAKIYKKQAQVNNNQMDNVSKNLLLPNSHEVTLQTDNENDYIRNFKKSVREEALSTRSSNTARSQDSHSEHFFVPLSGTGFSRVGPEKKAASLTSKQFNFDMLNDYDGVNGFISAAAASNYAESEGRLSFYDVEESHEQVFSPAFLMDASLSADSFEDLLAPLLETETALMEL
ncbi:augmin subunit 6 [Tanacetum coccineum]